jgi:hypothetical protein
MIENFMLQGFVVAYGSTCAKSSIFPGLKDFDASFQSLSGA